MKHILLLFLFIVASILCSQAQPTQTATGYTLPKGKKIYIPLELRNNDFTDKDSQWSYYRMACTPNIVCFWEKGFGEDLSKAEEYTYTNPGNIKKLYLVVVGCPTKTYKGNNKESVLFPYMVRF